MEAPRKTGRPCRVCGHADRAEIECELVAGKTPTKAISIRFGVSEQSLSRHRSAHLPRAAVAEAAEAAAEAEGIHGASLVEQASSLRKKALAILATAEKSGALETALRAIREAGRLLETEGKLIGVIDGSATVNITFAPVMVTLQATILAALSPYPEARAAVVMALQRVEGPAAIEQDAA